MVGYETGAIQKHDEHTTLYKQNIKIIRKSQSSYFKSCTLNYLIFHSVVGCETGKIQKHDEHTTLHKHTKIIRKSQSSYFESCTFKTFNISLLWLGLKLIKYKNMINILLYTSKL